MMIPKDTDTSAPPYHCPPGPRHYLITGGAGFIGSHLAEVLLERGHRVTAIDDLSTGRFQNIAHLVDHACFRYAIDTITNEVVMDRLVSECDVVIHLAAAVGVELIIKDPVHVIETNILGSRAVLQVASRYRKKVLLASTSEIYGKSTSVPFDEDDDRVVGPPTKARWSYSSSKAVDEFLALAYYRQMGLPVVVFRLFNTVGPRQTGRYGMVVPRFVRQALAGQPLTVYGDGSQTRCFLHVGDAVEAIVALAESPEASGHVFNVGSTEEVSILGLAERVLATVDALQPNERELPSPSPGEAKLANPSPGEAKLASPSSGEASGPNTDPETPSSGRPTAPTANRQPAHREDGRIVLVPYDEAYEAGFEDMQRRVPNISKIERVVGWTPTRTLEEILVDVARWAAGRQERQTKDDGP
jgi:UDP-glucose 4-epimerase